MIIMKTKILASLMTILALNIQTTYAAFPDTELSFYRDSIEQLASEGIISGYDDGRFGPDNTITRAEMLKVLFGTK
jgi:hypothetical protein